MGRTATGVTGMNLKDGSEIVGATGSYEGNLILVLTAKGFGKMSYAHDIDLEDGRHFDGYRVTKRGSKGVTTIKVTPKNGKLVAVRAVNGDEDLLVVTKQGIVIRTPLSEVKIAGRNTQGVKIINLEDKQTVASLSIVPHVDPEELAAEEAELAEEEAKAAAAEEVIATPDMLDAGLEKKDEE